MRCIFVIAGLPIVKFVCGQEVAVKPVRWTFKVAGGLYLTRKHIPLKLAWAISIHKSQVGCCLSALFT